MTDTAPPSPLSEADQVIARLNQDTAIAQNDRLLALIYEGIQGVRARLGEAGFVIYKHYELRHPSSGVTFGSSYAGGEYAIALSGLPGDRKAVTLRITPALQERDPMAIDRLGAIIVNIAAGAEYQVWTGAGNVVYGLWAESGDPEGVGLMFGEAYTEADQPAYSDDDLSQFARDTPDEPFDATDAAERAQLERDEGPPDMSGPGNPSGEGR